MTTTPKTPCEKTQIKYAGNGTRKNFPFTFTYMHFYDVKAALWDDTTKEYIVQTNKYVLDPTGTEVLFLVAPEEAPVSAPDGLNIKIYRDTDIDIMESVFYPGSSIRAQDLNDNFEQLQFAITENKCGIDSVASDLDDRYVNENDVLDQTEQHEGKWADEGTEQNKIPTTGAVAARHDAYVQDSLPRNPVIQQQGKTWQNTNKSHSSYWNEDAQAWVAYINSGPRGIQGPEGKKGVKGDKGDGLQVTGTIDYPGPPNSAGTDNDFIIDSNGVGWGWDGSQWNSTGSLKGPEGPEGPQGPQGIQGIPGTPGPIGAGNLDSVTGTLPIAVDQTDPRNPIVSLNISALTILPVPTP